MSSEQNDNHYSDITTCYLSKLRDRSYLYRGEATDSFLSELIALWGKRGKRGDFSHHELHGLIVELQRYAFLTGTALTGEDINAAITQMDCLLRIWMRPVSLN